jgi:hypothetical protein
MSSQGCIPNQRELTFAVSPHNDCHPDRLPRTILVAVHVIGPVAGLAAAARLLAASAALTLVLLTGLPLLAALILLLALIRIFAGLILVGTLGAICHRNSWWLVYDTTLKPPKGDSCRQISISLPMRKRSLV